MEFDDDDNAVFVLSRCLTPSTSYACYDDDDYNFERGLNLG